MRHSIVRPSLVTLCLLPLLMGCSSERRLTALEKVQAAGELKVVTRNSATTYFEGPHGPTGMEYDLARGFAEKLGVKLRLVVADSASDVLRRLDNGEADFAAAGLTVTDKRLKRYRFAPSYQSITQQLIYHRPARRPRNVGALGGHLEVMGGSSHVERLLQLKEKFPRLEWTENTEAESEELLTLLSEGVIDYTIADSNEVVLQRRFYPELRVAFNLSDQQPLAWAFRKSKDKSLLDAASMYMEEMKANGQIGYLLERHYGHVEEFDYVGSRVFQRHVRQRLPTYLPLFQEAADEVDLDWRLLAAVGYQESHWDPNAVSPTGVRGLMMLTSATARDLGVKERTDPEQSIFGGTRYLRSLVDRIPQRIQGPDRLWFSLAAYNIGLGHLEDARVLTQIRGGNPDRWSDVKENLPLLQKPKWHGRTRYGYARGNEAVRYVENIRSYYDILNWLYVAPPEAPPPSITIAASPVL